MINDSNLSWITERHSKEDFLGYRVIICFSDGLIVTALIATFLPAIIKKCTRYYIQVLTILAGPKTIDVKTLQCYLHNLHQTISHLSRMIHSFHHSILPNIASPYPISHLQIKINKDNFANINQTQNPNVNIKRNRKTFFVFQSFFFFLFLPPTKSQIEINFYERTLLYCTYSTCTVFYCISDFNCIIHKYSFFFKFHTYPWNHNHVHDKLRSKNLSLLWHS